MRAFVCALALVTVQAAWAESAFTTRAVDLLKDGQSDAAQVASLPENTRVEIIKRNGAWDEVKTASGQKGWVRMTALRPEADGSGAARTSSGIGSQLSNLLSTGRTANNATVTTGVRGLQEEDLRNAQANPDEFRKMQKYAASKDAGQAFAQRTRLAPAKVDYLNGGAAVNNKGNDSGAPANPGV